MIIIIMIMISYSRSDFGFSCLGWAGLPRNDVFAAKIAVDDISVGQGLREL